MEEENPLKMEREKFPGYGRKNSLNVEEKKSLKLEEKKKSLNMKKEKIPGEKKTNQDTGKYTMFGDASIIHDN